MPVNRVMKREKGGLGDGALSPPPSVQEDNQLMGESTSEIQFVVIFTKLLQMMKHFTSLE